MDYIDETIAAIRKQQNRKKELEKINLSEGIVLNYKRCFFAYMTYPQGKCTLMLPKEFNPMPEAMADRIYPARLRPQFIRCSPEGSETFTINLIADNTEALDQMQILMQMRQAISSVYSSSLFFDLKMVDTTNGEVA